jgi:hypothetical protein
LIAKERIEPIGVAVERVRETGGELPPKRSFDAVNSSVFADTPKIDR